MTREEQAQAGLERRTQVMGAAFVHKAQSSASAFTQPLQEHINRAASEAFRAAAEVVDAPVA